jgi:hypothetical protein
MLEQSSPVTDVSRRNFLAHAAAATAVIAGAPFVHAASKTSSPIITGEGDYQYRVIHNFPQLPSEFSWQTTHNVAVDSEANLYVIHEGRADLKDHPSIFVFDPRGKYIRSFGSQYQGGGHGIEIRKEGSEEFLYVCAYQHVKTFAKHKLTGETIWQKYAPVESGLYAPNEETPTAGWGRDRFLPTNFAFRDDGGFYLVDGYGSFAIHEYDKDANWKRCFGGPGEGEGKFNTSHGIWVDNRPGREPALVVCDRAHHTLQYLSLDGVYQSTITGFGLPANAETWNNLLCIPELHARLTLMDEHNNVVARLGNDVGRITGPDGGKVRGDAALWQDGKFVHPHDACFGLSGDLFVAEWVGTGRVTKLERLG